MTRRFSVSGGGESTLRPAGNRRAEPQPRAATRGRIGQANERQQRHAINLSSGTPRPKTMKESLLRQVSWLSVQRAPPTFPDASSGMCWRSARRLQLRGQPRNSDLAAWHRIPVLIPLRGTFNGSKSSWGISDMSSARPLHLVLEYKNTTTCSGVSRASASQFAGLLLVSLRLDCSALILLCSIFPGSDFFSTWPCKGDQHLSVPR